MPDEPVAVAEPTSPVVETSAPAVPVEVVEPVAQAATTPEDKQAVPVIPPAPAITSTSLPTTLPPEVQDYVARLEDQARSARDQAELQVLDQTVAQYAAQIEQQYGLTPDQAKAIAKQQGDIIYKQFQSERLRHGQVRAAIAIAKEFNADPMQLIDLPSPQAMRQAAQAATAVTKQAEELAQLRAKVVALEKGRVPAQTFAQGAQPGTGTGLTGDALEAAWLKHEVEQPDKPNPHDVAYRTMLRR